MKCRLIGQENGEVRLEIIVDAAVYELAVADELARIDPACATDEKSVICSNRALVANHPKKLDILRAAIQAVFSGCCAEVYEQTGIVPISDPYVQPVDGDIGDDICLLVRVQVVPGTDQVALDSIEVSYPEVYADGSEVDARLERTRQILGVQTNEDLLRKTAAFSSVEEMRQVMSETLEQLIVAINEQAKREAASKALVKAFPVEVSKEQIDAYVEAELNKLISQIGAETLESRLSAGAHDIDALRRMIRRDVGHKPQLNVVLDAFARKMSITVTDEDRLKEIEAIRAQGLDPDTMPNAESTLEEVQQDSRLLSALDREVCRTKALERAMGQMKFRVSRSLPIAEGAPQYLKGGF